MNHLFSALTAIFRKITVIFALIAVIALPNFVILQNPSWAAKTNDPKLEQTFSAEDFEQEYPAESYEEAVKSAKTPETLEKEYEKNLKIYKDASPDKGGLVETAKEVVEKVTGND